MAFLLVVGKAGLGGTAYRTPENTPSVSPQHAPLGSTEQAARNVSYVDTMISAVLLVASLSSLSVCLTATSFQNSKRLLKSSGEFPVLKQFDTILSPAFMFQMTT